MAELQDTSTNRPTIDVLVFEVGKALGWIPPDTEITEDKKQYYIHHWRHSVLDTDTAFFHLAGTGRRYVLHYDPVAGIYSISIVAVGKLTAIYVESDMLIRTLWIAFLNWKAEQKA